MRPELSHVKDLEDYTQRISDYLAMPRDDLFNKTCKDLYDSKHPWPLDCLRKLYRLERS